jgi:hypothetical protein
MGLDVTQVQLFGPVAVSIGGADVGHTDDAGVKMELKNTVVNAMAGKYGKVPVASWLNGQTAEITFNLIQTDFDNLAEVLPGALKVTDGSDTKLTFGRGAGFVLAPVELVLAPFPAGQSPRFNLKAARAVPVGDFTITYTGDAHNSWACKFQVLIDEAGGQEGSFLFTFGDPSVTSDVVAPSITSVAPADGVTGVAVTANVVWNASEDLDPSSVSTATVKLIAAPLTAPTAVAGTVGLSNNGTATVITFNPTANLGASTQHLAVLDGVRDRAGNALPLYASDFTTA